MAFVGNAIAINCMTKLLVIIIMRNDAHGQVAFFQCLQNVCDHRPAIKIYQAFILTHPAAFSTGEDKGFYV